jgi:anti-anti-sigma factor
VTSGVDHSSRLEVSMSQTSSLPRSEVLSKPAVPPFVCACKADRFGSVCLHLEGELDLANVPAFKHALQRAQSEAEIVSLDLQELAFIDCSALKEVLDADALARQTGRTLILVRGAGQVDRVMALTGLLEQMEVREIQSTG